jgi:hypothetical protein
MDLRKTSGISRTIIRRRFRLDAARWVTVGISMNIIRVRTSVILIRKMIGK